MFANKTTTRKQARDTTTGTLAHRRSGLGVESLEGRAMMTGNVGAFVDAGGSLNITGDSRDNAVEVIQLAPTTFSVRPVNYAGLGPTTVNGSSLVRTFFNVSNNINVTLNGGSDYFKIGGASEFTRTTLPNNLSIDGGSGNDRVEVSWLSNRDANDSISITTGDGNDTVALYKVVCRNWASVSTGAGWDTVDVRNVTVNASLNVSTGSEADDLRVNNSVINRLFADMGTGNDTVQISWNYFATDAYVNGGDGFDTMTTAWNNRVIRRFSI